VGWAGLLFELVPTEFPECCKNRDPCWGQCGSRKDFLY